MSGWIKLYRDLNKHWIWDNSDYLKWWLDILLEVNHTDSKVVIKNKIYECKRGEKLYSLDTWATRWKTNKSKVRRFFELLQKDSMILLKNETQTTRLIVCKYEDYQELRHADETHLTRKRHANETHLTPIQEEKEYKEEKDSKPSLETRSIAFKETLRPFLNQYGTEMLKSFYNYWSEPNQSKTKMLFEMQRTWETSRRLSNWSKREKTFTSKEDKPKTLGI
jgi:hypothetical protein